MFHRFIRLLFLLVLFISSGFEALAQCPDTHPKITGPDVVGANSNPVQYTTPNVAGHTYSWVVKQMPAGTVINTSSADVLNQVWSTPGDYQIELSEGILGNGCTPVAVTPPMSVLVKPMLAAYFYYEPDAEHGCYYNEVTFTATGNGIYPPVDPSISYDWYWGVYNPPAAVTWVNTNITSIGPNNSIVKILYPPTSGVTYATKLIVSKTIAGRVWTDEITDFVFVDPDKYKPVVVLATPTTPNCLNQAFNFSAEGSLATFMPTNETFLYVDWDYGDGTTQRYELINGVPPQLTTTHVYTVPANGVIVTVTLTNTINCVVSKSITIDVPNTIPVAAFTVAQTCVNEPAPFTETSFPGSGSLVITDWYWNWGDGSGTEHYWLPGNAPPVPVTHVFTDLLPHDVTLKVVNSNGCENTTIAFPVLAQPSPKADFSYPLVICGGDIVQFNSSLSSPLTGTPIASYLWDFDDPGSPSNSSTDPNPTHMFSTTGPFHVSLTVTNQAGCANTKLLTNPLVVNPHPDVDFTTLQGVTVNTWIFTSQINVNQNVGNNVYWEFGDGTNGFGSPITHVYPGPGSYIARCTGIDMVTGCSTVVEHPVTVGAPPAACFTANPPNQCMNVPVLFVPCPAGGSITTEDWDFGDGTTAQFVFPFVPASPNHSYTTAGTYQVIRILNLGTPLEATFSLWVTIYDAPTATFVWYSDPTHLHQGQACDGQDVYFEDKSFTVAVPPGTMYRWEWNFGDPLSGPNNTSTVQNPTHTFTSSVLSGITTYDVTLQVWENLENCPSPGKMIPVSINPPIPVEFTFNNNVCLDQTVNFTTDPLVLPPADYTWLWDFGDGNSSTASGSAANLYASVGNYVVTLTLTDINGCSKSIQHTVSIIPKPIANFIYTSPSCFGTEIQFTSQSFVPLPYNDVIVGWDWNFGDGNTATGTPTPSHTYAVFSPTGYDVTLTVTTNRGCSQSKTINVLQIAAPVADFEILAGTFSCVTPQAVQFNSLLSQTNGGGIIIAWLWNFGDLSTSTTQNPSHVYTTPGTKTVTLTITNANGCSNTVSHDIIINELPVAYFTTSTACEGTAMQFTDASTTTPTGTTIVSYSWDFGDGGTSALGSPLHTFATFGIYPVTLTIINSNGCSHSVTIPVTIHPKPIVEFTFTPASCVGNPVSFNDLSFIPSGFTEAIDTWEWDFDDTSPPLVIQAPNNPDVIYTFLGAATSHNVKLTVTTLSGCTAFIVKTVNSIPSPIASYSVAPVTCIGQSVQFTSNSQTGGGGSIVSWGWNFGDPLSGTANTSLLENPTHNFTGPGPFTIMLTVTSSNGCVSTYSGPPVTMNALPVASFDNNDACEESPTTFTNTSTPNSAGGGFISYAWNFGDGGTSTQANPQHIFPAFGNYVVTLTVVNDNGCSHTVTQTITVNPKPIADFSFSAASCVGNPVNYFNQSFMPGGSTSFIETWQWDFGDGSTIPPIVFPNDPNITHTFSGTASSHVVRLTVTTFNGCTSFIEKTVTSVASPLANFSTANNVCANQPAQFTDLSQPTGSIQTWSWNFGDPGSGLGNTSTIQNPIHQFSASGPFTVILIVTNGNGCVHSDTVDITVNAKPFSDFTATTECLGELTTFTNAATAPAGTIASYLWDFGDNQTSTAANPTHLYATSGTYNVKLTVASSLGCVKDTTKQIEVLGKPNALFSVASPNCSGDSVQFNDLSSTPHGTIVRWEWDFDDGTGAVIHFPDNQDVKHKFPNGGTFNVKLTIITSDSCNNFKILPVQIGFSPVANFTSLPSGCALAIFQFTDQSQMNGGPSITTWHWDFGDPGSGANNISTTQNPTHNFTIGGIDTVRLIVTNANGCVDSIKKVVTIHDVPTAEFSFSADTTCMGSPIQFTDASTTPTGTTISVWAWNFGDPASGTNNVSSDQDPIHTFNTQGVYTVTLQVTNSNQCVKDTSMQITVNPKPTAMFQYTAACVGSETQFTDMSIAPGSSINFRTWDFGDGTPVVVNVTNPVHTYAAAGTFQVQLIVSNLANCTDTVIIPVIARPRPLADFTSTGYFCPSGKVDFQDISTATASSIAERLWVFEPGFTSNIPNPTHTFPVTNMIYPVTLTVTDTYGCTDDTIVDIFVKPGFTFSFTNNNACEGHPTQFDTINVTPGDNLYNVSWNFGDPGSVPNNTSLLMNPSHTFAKGGTYIVKMKAYNSDNCVDSVYHEVIVYDAPEPLFSVVSTPCDSTLHFTDSTLVTGSGTIASWRWNFGDTPTDVIINAPGPGDISHLYMNPGFYTVKLVMTTSNGCSDSISRVVQRYPCIASGFTFNDTLCARNKIAFSDTSLPVTLINQWQWTWGDGSDTTYNVHATPVTHTYADSGTYFVKLKIWALVDGTNITDSLTSRVIVRPTPITLFSNIPVCLNQISLFRDTSKTFGVGVSKWEWTLGPNPTDTSTYKNPTHIYDTAGIYNVQLITTNRYGCKDSLTKPTRVYGLPVAHYDNTIACTGDPTYFTDKSDTSETRLAFWSWDFGDITSMRDTSNLQNPSYRYPNTGDYTVRMIVRDDFGCIATVDSTVKVNPTPMSSFTVLNGYNGKQGQVKLNNLSVGDSLSYNWDFGNGKYSFEKDPVALFTEDNTYTIKLISVNPFGCSDTTFYTYELLFKGLYVPNAFSPSGTNLGVRLFQPIGMNLKQYHVTVFDMWGHLMWESTKLDDKGMPTEGWDGTFEGVLMPQANYMWKISALFVDDSQWEGSDIGVGGSTKTMGTVTLIR